MRRKTMPAAAGAALVLLAAALVLGDFNLSPTTAQDPPPTEAAAPAADAPEGSMLDLLDTLTVSEQADTPGYDADLFGWRNDTDKNGCDTRADVLRRDLDAVTVKPDTRGCVVASGVLPSPYSGEAVQFVAGDDGGDVDIDHVVARENAWQSGAANWSGEELVRFGNDPLNLLAVEASLNRSHGSRAADEWVPSTDEGACDFVARQVAVKAEYELTVTESEHEAIAGVLTGCPGGGELPEAVEWPEPEG